MLFRSGAVDKLQKGSPRKKKKIFEAKIIQKLNNRNRTACTEPGTLNEISLFKNQPFTIP